MVCGLVRNQASAPKGTPHPAPPAISPEFALPARHSLLLPAHACTYTSTHCRPVHDDPRMPAPCPASAELNVIPSFARRISIAAAWIRSGPRASLLLQLDGAAMGGKDYQCIVRLDLAQPEHRQREPQVDTSDVVRNGGSYQRRYACCMGLVRVTSRFTEQ